MLTHQEQSSATQPATRSGTLTAALLLRTVLILVLGITVPLLVRAVAPDTTATEASMWGNAWVILVDVITLVAVGVLLAREGRRIRDLLNFRASDIGWGLLFTVIVVIGFLVFTFIGNLIAYQGAPPISTETVRVPLVVGLLAIIAAFTIGIAEELIYRGYLQPRFERRLGRWPGMLLVAFVFGLQHLGFALISPQAAVAKVITTFAAGILFGLLYWWRKRLMPLVIAHVILDIIGLGIPTLMLALA